MHDVTVSGRSPIPVQAIRWSPVTPTLRAAMILPPSPSLLLLLLRLRCSPWDIRVARSQSAPPPSTPEMLNHPQCNFFAVDLPCWLPPRVDVCPYFGPRGGQTGIGRFSHWTHVSARWYLKSDRMTYDGHSQTKTPCNSVRGSLVLPGLAAIDPGCLYRMITATTGQLGSLSSTTARY